MKLRRTKRQETPHLLRQGPDGPELVRADYVPHGLRYEGVYYPTEFLKPLGRSNYFLATAMMMPSDGNLTVGGGVPESKLQPAPQPVYTAHWQSFDLARRRCNWESLMERGNGTSSAIRNVVMGLVICATLYGSWGSWGLKSSTGRLGDQLTVLTGQIERVELAQRRSAPPTGGNPGVGIPGDEVPALPSGPQPTPDTRGITDLRP